ncbi:MAG: hypothetical protein LC774_17355, partial [Acidobacteria bacterium]|nr:hypothetical protein [Acidobacteriota bacterium]
ISRMYSGTASGDDDDSEGPSWGQSFNWTKRIKWAHLIYGLLLLIVFGLWTYSLYNRRSWWALATGFVAFGGVGNLMLAFDTRSNRTSAPDQGSAPEHPSTPERE